MQVEAEPNDHMALAKWGELLLELAMLKQGEEATTILLQVNSQKKNYYSLIPTLNKRTQPHSPSPPPPFLSLPPSLPPLRHLASLAEHCETRLEKSPNLVAHNAHALRISRAKLLACFTSC